jgi:hypothetical protein
VHWHSDPQSFYICLWILMMKLIASLFFLDLSFIWTSFWSYCGCDHMCMCEFYLLFRAAWICERIMKINEKSLGLKINGYLCCFHILLFFFLFLCFNFSHMQFLFVFNFQ